jgi:hypothetical protein
LPEPPVILSVLPNGVSMASNATVPTTKRLMKNFFCKDCIFIFIVLHLHSEICICIAGTNQDADSNSTKNEDSSLALRD